jgi:hypothetical protein
VSASFHYPVAWRRLGARCHYAGTLDAEDGRLMLRGREPSTGLEVTLGIPEYAVRSVRTARSDEEEVVGVRGLVLDLADAIPLLLRPLGVGPLHDDELARVLATALHRPMPRRDVVVA